LAPYVDHIFSGESEQTFPAFLRTLLGGGQPHSRIIEGSPCRDLDAIPTTEFSEYFEQRERVTPEFRPARTYLPYESSRGCWWGQKHHCTFCGLNGQGMAFREKSPDRVISDLRALSAAHGTNHFCLTDNIMPHSYFKTLLPRLAQENVDLFYEQKANLSLDDVLALKRAGIQVIQPGIEALSTLLLRRMDKGVQGRQNVSLLRYARAAGMDVQWNLLWGFPGDEPEAYEETLAMVQLMGHLQPPTGLIHLGIDRFSPYFDRAARYGIRNVRAHPIYARAFPGSVELDKIAYRFVGDYACGAHRSMDVVTALGRAIADWRARWERERPPTLRVNQFGELFILRDTRGLAGTRDHLVLDRSQAFDLLSPRPYTSDAAPWVEQKLGLHVDGWYVPLATAATDLLVELEQRARELKKPRNKQLPMFAHTA
ncbi:MAG TPA: RiPP maturation radical SAM C-methyltransferase, partial [Polyangiaceae bacterium]|nr:RiPP maturation radical SAM C-methyltransferase [Polyangiaceae bacterium]